MPSKRPTIFSRGKYFWVYYNYGTDVRRSTGILLDIPPGKGEEWYRKSKYRKDLDLYIRNIERAESFRSFDIPITKEFNSAHGLSVETLLLQWNEHNEEERDLPLSPRTLEKRELAVKFLRKFRPGFRLAELDEEFVKKFRAWGKKQLKTKSLNTYWIEYRALFNYAKSKRLIETNPFKRYTVHVERNPPKQISKEDVDKLLPWLFEHKIELWAHVAAQLFNGLRVGDTCVFRKEWIDSKQMILRYWNSKSRVWELHPITSIMAWVLDEIAPGWRTWYKLPANQRETGYLFAFRNRKTVNYYLVRACEFAGVEKVTTHDLKRLYTQLLAKENPDPRIFDMLVHHAPSVNPTAVEHYQGRDPELMKQVLEPVLEKNWRHLIIEHIRSGKPSPYNLSNPKSSEARKKRKFVHSSYTPETEKRHP